MSLTRHCLAPATPSEWFMQSAGSKSVTAKIQPLIHFGNRLLPVAILVAVFSLKVGRQTGE